MCARFGDVWVLEHIQRKCKSKHPSCLTLCDRFLGNCSDIFSLVSVWFVVFLQHVWQFCRAIISPFSHALAVACVVFPLSPRCVVFSKSFFWAKRPSLWSLLHFAPVTAGLKSRGDWAGIDHDSGLSVSGQHHWWAPGLIELPRGGIIGD